MKYKISRRGKAQLIKTLHEGENAEEEHFSCLLFSVWMEQKDKSDSISSAGNCVAPTPHLK
jgi:hypothetical protein